MTELKVVKKGSDYRWLRKKAGNKKTLQLLKEIEESEKLIEKDIFSTDTSFVPLTLGKYTYWFRRSDASYSLQIYTEIFRENDHFLVDYLMPKDSAVAIDLGANMGFFTLKLKELCPKCKVIAVEPDPEVFASLTKNIEKNNVKGVELVNKAVADVNTYIPFYTSINAGVLGSKYLRTLKRDLRTWLKDKMIQKTEVPAVTLKSLVKQYNLKTIDLIKLDIEDMEYEVLKAGESILKDVRAIVMQWHSIQTRDQIIELLKKNGFGISYYEPRDYGDIYFANSRFTHL